MSTGPNMVPEVPGLARLAWLLFMQPVQLRDAIMRWGLDPMASGWQLWKTACAGNRYAAVLLRRLALLLGLGAPLAAVGVCTLSTLAGVPVQWSGVTIGVAGGVVGGALGGVVDGATFGVALGVAFAVTGGVVFAVAGGVAYAVAFGVALGVAVGGALGVRDSATYGREGGPALVVVPIGAFVAGAIVGRGAFVSAVFFTVGVVSILRPIWLAEGALTLLLSAAIKTQGSHILALARWLPPLHDDLIMFPLPGLHRCILAVAAADAAQGKKLLARAAVSPGLRETGQRVLLELQGRSLERAAREDDFQSAINLDLPFLPDSRDPSATIFKPFQAAAQDLLAGGRSQHQRRQALGRAHSVLQSFLLGTDLTNRDKRRLRQTCQIWLDIVEQRLRALESEPAEVPLVFVAGTALKPSLPDERSLFKGREDVVRLIEHDLAPTRRGVIFVLGQRRMGKSSLSNWLPRLLGTGTTIVACDFQTLSGDEHRSHPHLRIIEGIGKAVAGLPEPPQQSSSWRDALAWLQTIDPVLAERRILVTIDEVERVEDGIRDGWCTTDFLDFLRATGDAVTNIRVVLLSAFPLRRLGRHWVDRLISVTSLSISYLSTAHASELLQHPVPDFPPIYPEGGVDDIVAKTHGHPYLLQRVGDELVRRLNLRGAHQATDDDVTAVLDTVVNEGDVPFLEIWDTRTEAERAVLRRLASAESSMDPAHPELDRDATTELVRDGYLERQGERLAIAVPLFRDWIRLFKL